MNDTHSTVSHPVIKIITAWLAAYGITSWGDAASVVAFAYTVLLLVDFVWKKVGRAAFERRGWIKRKVRRKSDEHW
jgi:hypothetical protein